MIDPGDLCIVGNVNRDVKLAPIPPGPRLFADGEDGVPWIVETIGGGGANSAAVAAGLGARVAFLGKVGRDSLGERLEEALQRCGVRTRLARSSECSTGTSVALAFTDGRRHFLSCLPNNETLRFEDLDLSALQGFTHLYRADVWFSEAMLYGGNRRLFEHARRAGMRVSIDLNWDPKWGAAAAEEIDRRKQAIRDVLPLVDVAHGNVRELSELAGAGDLDTALRRLEAWGVEAVVVHLGSEGAGYYHRGSLVVEEPVPAARIVNTTGTGDVLSVCMMLMDRHDRMPIPDRLRTANGTVTEFMEGRRRFIPEI